LDHVLLIGFGAPSSPEDVGPYLRRFAENAGIPETRLDSVRGHYEAIGGASPYLDQVMLFSDHLTKGLQSVGLKLPVFVGMKNWHPFIRAQIGEIREKGFRIGAGMILSPYASWAGYDEYVREVGQAVSSAGGGLQYRYPDAWYDHPLWIEALRGQILKAQHGLSEKEKKSVPLLFCAHSVPQSADATGQYGEQIRFTAGLVADQIGHSKWSLAYQSRSGSPAEPWLGPGLLEEIGRLKERGEKSVLIVPLGFVCDNAEILYDLDVEARREVLKLGMEYRRAGTVMSHPVFVDLFVELIGML
jgi:ferrochelatase